MLNMAKKRKRGERYPEGYIKKQIMRFVCDYPDGIEEPKIRDWLKENYGISEKKGIVAHLQELEEKMFLIMQPQRGKENIWKPNPDREIFGVIWSNELQNNEEVLSFFNSKYTQRMISNEYMAGYRGLKSEEDNVEPFFEEGMKLSPTFLHYTIHAGLPEVEVGAGLLQLVLEASPHAKRIGIYRGEGPKKYDITLQIEYSAELLYVSLLIDAKKYPELRSKILDFFESPAFGPPYFNFPSPDSLII